MMIGPRALRNQQLFIQQALEQKEYEKMNQEQDQCQRHDYACNCSNCILYESTARAAQRHTITNMNTLKYKNDSNDNTIESDNENKAYFDDEAITFWSQHILKKTQKQDKNDSKNDSKTYKNDNGKKNMNIDNSNHSVNNENNGIIVKKRKQTFARCTSFTNDIYDGRLNHDAKII